MDPYDPPLDTARHLRYWKRCVSTLLPHHYTSMDSTRLSLGFFIMASIDLLTPPPPPTNTTATATTTTIKPLLTPADRVRLRRWVLSCQHPRGGFCGSPTHVLPREHQQSDVENAHIGGTYFALLILALLADDDDDDGKSADAAFAGVDRARTLRWLRRLQRPEDGSFGEAVYDPPSTTTTTTKTTKTTTTGGEKQTGDREDGSSGDSTPPPQPMIAGGRDMRYSYLAAAVRWMLRGDTSDSSASGPEDPDYVEDIDVPALVAHIRRAQTYDGGFAETWAHESHAGYGYCAVAALSLLDRPPEGPGAGGSQAVREGVPDVPALVGWLASRQFEYVQGSGDAEDEDADEDDPNFRFAALSLSDGPTGGSGGGAQNPPPPARHVGFNGRCNKVADTCYTWWNLGTLAVLDIPPSSSSTASGPETGTAGETETDDPANLRARRAFLLDKTQHLIGGFGKHPGSPPDVGHACLGLAALATMGDPSLRRLDPALCVSVETVRKVERARRGLLRRQVGEGEGEGVGGVGVTGSGRRLVDMAIRMGGGERSEWLDAVA